MTKKSFDLTRSRNRLPMDRDNLDTGLGDETPKVPVPAEPNEPVRNTPPAGEWNDVSPEHPPAKSK